jgi:HPt (histidine-containing phosphotransfer) domain-containing protein
MNENLKVCNLDYLYELAKGDMGFVQEMIDVFITDTPAEVESLGDRIKDRNYAEIRQIAHKLRSTIPYVGLDANIGDEVSEIEELAGSSSDIKTIESLFIKVKDFCKKAFSELRAYKI